jgi:hypothetical protein
MLDYINFWSMNDKMNGMQINPTIDLTKFTANSSGINVGAETTDGLQIAPHVQKSSTSWQVLSIVLRAPIFLRLSFGRKNLLHL